MITTKLTATKLKRKHPALWVAVEEELRDTLLLYPDTDALSREAQDRIAHNAAFIACATLNKLSKKLRGKRKK